MNPSLQPRGIGEFVKGTGLAPGDALTPLPEVFGAQCNPAEREQISVVLSAFRSAQTRFLYIPVAITSGKRMYDLCSELKLSPMELRGQRQVLFDRVIKPNLDDGLHAAELMRKWSPLPIVLPSIFEAKALRWSQPAFMALWSSFILERGQGIALSGDFEYSDGGSEEYVLAVRERAGFGTRSDLTIQDSEGSSLSFDYGFALIGSALRRLESRGFASERLATSFAMLYRIHRFFMSDVPADKYAGIQPANDFFRYDSRAVEAIRDELVPTFARLYNPHALGQFTPSRRYIERVTRLVDRTQPFPEGVGIIEVP